MNRVRLRALLQQAQMAGLQHDELEAVAETLIMLSAKFKPGGRLKIAFAQQSEAQRAETDEFLAAQQDISSGLISEGESLIDGLSDEQWESLRNEEDNE